jgi:hypothetical protein
MLGSLNKWLQDAAAGGAAAGARKGVDSRMRRWVRIFWVLLIVVALIVFRTLQAENDESGDAAAPATDVSGAATSISSSVSLGSTGTDVAVVQQALVDAGYDVPVNGVFDEQTEQAVREFQAAEGLTVDGIVGPQTATQLGVWATG